MAATILMVMAGILSRAHHGLRRLWNDTRQFQLATDELCNQLQWLLALPRPELEAALADLRINPEIADALPEAQLAAQLLDDADGARLQLSLNWQRVGVSEPLQLTGWLVPQATLRTTVPAPAEAADSDDSSASPPPLDEPPAGQQPPQFHGAEPGGPA